MGEDDDVDMHDASDRSEKPKRRRTSRSSQAAEELHTLHPEQPDDNETPEPKKPAKKKARRHSIKKEATGAATLQGGETEEAFPEQISHHRSPQKGELPPQPSKGGLVDLFGDNDMRAVEQSQEYEEDSANVDPLRLEVLEAERQAGKEALEREREETMREIPESYVKQFGQIGFAKCWRMLMPVLILDPYKVPPNPVRKDWLKQLKKSAGSKSSKSCWVGYWYGFAETEPNTCYSYLKPNDVTLYSAAVKKKVHKLPKHLQKKLENKKPLSDRDKSIVRAFQEMEEDLGKDPVDRNRGVPFLESWESLTLEDIPVQSATDQQETDELPEELLGEEDADSKPPAKKKPEKKKRSTKKKKERKAASKEKPDAMELPKEETGDKEHLEEQEEPPPTETAEQPHKPDAYDEVTMDQIGEKEESSDDDNIDGDYEEGGVPDAADDAAELDYDESVPKTSRPRQEQSPRKPKSHPSVEPTKKPTARKPKKEVSERTKKDRERKAFRECERLYSGLLNEWNDTLEQGNPVALVDVLNKVLEKVEDFSATFFETYDVPKMLKKSKSLLKTEKNAELKIYREVHKTCKVTYEQKKKAIPEGFKMKKSFEEAGKAKPSKSNIPQEKVMSRPSSPVKVTQDETVASSKSGTHVQSATIEATTAIDIVIPKKGDGKGPGVSPPRKKPVSGAPSGGERKQFSLMGLMSHGQKEENPAKEAGRQVAPVAPVAPKAHPPVCSRTIPWMTEPYATSDPLSDSERLMALEFLREMASQFPEDKMNRDAIARSIEAAIHKEAKRKDEHAWSDLYWEKVHMVVACIMGRSKPGSEPGTLLHMLTAGQFPSAESLVALSDDQFAASYEGQRVSLTRT